MNPSHPSSQQLWRQTASCSLFPIPSPALSPQHRDTGPWTPLGLAAPLTAAHRDLEHCQAQQKGQRRKSVLATDEAGLRLLGARSVVRPSWGLMAALQSLSFFPCERTAQGKLPCEAGRLRAAGGDRSFIGKHKRQLEGLEEGCVRGHKVQRLVFEGRSAEQTSKRLGAGGVSEPDTRESAR